MGRPQVSFAKRQREQAKRDKKQAKAERRSQKKPDGESTGPEMSDEVISETPEEVTPTP